MPDQWGGGFSSKLLIEFDEAGGQNPVQSSFCICPIENPEVFSPELNITPRLGRKVSGKMNVDNPTQAALN